MHYRTPKLQLHILYTIVYNMCSWEFVPKTEVAADQKYFSLPPLFARDHWSTDLQSRYKQKYKIASFWSETHNLETLVLSKSKDSLTDK